MNRRFSHTVYLPCTDSETPRMSGTPIQHLDVELPLFLYPSRKSVVLMLVVSMLLLTVGGVLMLSAITTGIIITTISLLMIAAFGSQFFRRAAYLLLDEDSFTFCTMFRSFTYAWGEIEAFRVISTNNHKMVGWTFTDGVPLTRMMKLAHALSGCHGSLPDTYGRSAEELATLMETIRSIHVNPSSIITTDDRLMASAEHPVNRQAQRT